MPHQGSGFSLGRPRPGTPGGGTPLPSGRRLASMVDLNYWFHGDDETYALLVADDPVDLHDDSGNSRVVSQDVPALFATGERTHPVFNFFGNKHYKVTAASQFCTLYAAYRAPYFDGYRRLMQGHNDAVNMDVNFSTGVAGITLYSGSGLGYLYDANTWHLVTAVFNDNNSQLFINGIQVNNGNVGANICDDFVLGGEYNLGAGQFFEGYLADQANFSTIHDDATLTSVMSEMMDFWSIAKPTATSSTATIDDMTPTVLQQISVSTDASITTFSDRTRYQWKADNINIVGATGENYTVQSVDLGKDLRCTVTPVNRWGDGTPRTSDPTAPVVRLDLTQPGSFNAIGGPSSADLTWTEPPDRPLGYDLRWTGDMGADGTRHLNSGDVSTNVGGFNTGENITFWIKTTGDGGGIAESSEASANATAS